MPTIEPGASHSIGSLIKPILIKARFNEPNFPSNCRIPIAPTKGGMINGTIIKVERIDLKGKLYFVNIKPSIVPIKRDRRVVQDASDKEFKKAC